MSRAKKRMQLNEQTREKLPERAAEGFVSAPTAEQLKPTEREAVLLKTLWDWQESSARSPIVLGEPLCS